MYIDITTHCPMSCEHCCRDFGKGRPTQKQHMTHHIYSLAVDIAEELGEQISLGGGEPLSHPDFWEFFIKAYRANVDGVWLATSGAHTKRTHTLLQLMGENYEPLREFESQYDPEDDYYPYPIGGMIDWLESIRQEQQEDHHAPKFFMALSQDIYHNPIPEYLSSWAKHLKNVEIRDVTHNVNMLGRAIETGAYTSDKQSCEDLHCDILGNLSICRTHPDGALIGHVTDDPSIIAAIKNRASEIEECKHHWTKKQWEYVRNG